MKVKIIVSILTSIFILVGGVLFIRNKFSSVQTVTAVERYRIEGAVQNKDLSYEKTPTYEQLFLDAHLLASADVSSFKLSNKVTSRQIYVPYFDSIVNKVDFMSLTSSFLWKATTNLSKSLCTKLAKFVKEHEYDIITWELIGQIPGVGTVTLKTIKALTYID